MNFEVGERRTISTSKDGESRNRQIVAEGRAGA
jgi:hypothetical protein